MTSSTAAMIMVLLLCAFSTDIYAEPTRHSSQDFQTRASFDLAVQKSMVLRLGKSRLETKSEELNLQCVRLARKEFVRVSDECALGLQPALTELSTIDF